MEVQFLAQGIFLPAIGLWLDPRVPVEAAWLSHAHIDHARGVHALALGTPQTLDLYVDRWPEAGPRRRLVPMPPGEPLAFRGARLTACPAAHILGAAQLLVEFQGERLVYTGDIKLLPPLLGWRTEPVPCDTLILESTFGLPVFHFLPADAARDRITAFAAGCLERGETPVFLGYPLGRGQEIVHVLAHAGLPVAVHGAIARYLPHYEKAGYTFPGWQPYAAGATQGRALVLTPSMRAQAEASVRRPRIAYVSGWAMLDAARSRTGADELIPYSDHGGFSELLDIARLSGARTVHLVHGYTEPLALMLRERGIDARPHGAMLAPAMTAQEAGA